MVSPPVVLRRGLPRQALRRCAILFELRAVRRGVIVALASQIGDVGCYARLRRGQRLLRARLCDGGGHSRQVRERLLPDNELPDRAQYEALLASA